MAAGADAMNKQTPTELSRQRVLFLCNIPAPYRIDFFNELGKCCALTVVFEARRAAGIRFNWNEDTAKHFTAIFLSDGEIDETHVDRRIFSQIPRGRYDRIVATSYGYYTETAALVSLRLRGIPYDIEIDGGVVRAGENPFKRALKRFLISGATRLFSTGSVADALFLHYGAQERRIVRYPFTSLHARDVLTAVPTQEARRAAKDALGITSERLVLSIGQFIYRKGYDVLLRGCNQLDASASVAIIGGTPTDDYRRIVEENGLTRVRFLPFMEKERLAQWFLAADVFVLPTREDMWGLVVNEALSQALPVVTTDRCNAGVELVIDGETGYLTAIEDGAALMERVNRILRDDVLRRHMAEAAIVRMRAYTIEAMVDVHAREFGLPQAPSVCCE